MGTVVIACRNPGGVILSLSDGESVTLNGPPPPASGLNPGFGNAGAGFTTIDADFWSTWSGSNASGALIGSGAVWLV